jgi:hypothetical protein
MWVSSGLVVVSTGSISTEIDIPHLSRAGLTGTQLVEQLHRLVVGLALTHLLLDVSGAQHLDLERLLHTVSVAR